MATSRTPISPRARRAARSPSPADNPASDLTGEHELTLALTAAAAARRERAQAIAALATAVDQRLLAELLARHDVLALLGARLQAAAPGAVGSELAERINHAVDANARRAVVLEAVLSQVLGVLEGRGISAVPFKGPTLARRAHGDAALRSAGDLDLLVSPDDLHPAVSALVAQGYAVRSDPERPDGLPELHYRLDHPEPWGPRIELHWRVHWADERHGEAIVSRAAPAGAGGSLTPAASDDLAMLLLCYARDGFVGVRLAADIAGLWDRLGADLGPNALEPFAVAHPDLVPALASAALVAQTTAAVPAGVLFSESTLRCAPKRALRLADPLALSDPQQLRAQTVLIEQATIPRTERPGFRRRLRARAAEAGGPSLPYYPKLAARGALALLRPPSRLVRTGDTITPVPRP
jgi:hypothetical protein